MNVSAFVSGAAYSISETDRVENAARAMRDHDVGFLPVVDAHKRLTGVITDRDLVIRVMARGRSAARTRVREVMTTGPFATCGLDDDVSIAAERMAAAQVSRIVVLDAAERVAGVLSLSDLAARADAGAYRVLRAVTRREAPH